MLLYQGNYFKVVFVMWSQAFPGDCIISSEKESLSELTKEEWMELGELEKELERITKKLFSATMFNFACLMNNAYRDHEKPHVHFHFVPRYEKEIVLFGKKYQDCHFGYNFWKWELSDQERQPDIFSKEEKKQIYELMKQEWKFPSNKKS